MHRNGYRACANFIANYGKEIQPHEAKYGMGFEREAAEVLRTHSRRSRSISRKGQTLHQNPPWVNRARTAVPQPIKTTVLLSHQLTRWSTS